MQLSVSVHPGVDTTCIHISVCTHVCEHCMWFIVCVCICVCVCFLHVSTVTSNLWGQKYKWEVRVAHGSPLAWLFALSEDIYIWNEQLRKMGLISPLLPRALPSCWCRVNLSQMRWLEPDPLSQIPSPCTLEPHEISKLKPSVIGVSPTLHKSNSKVMLWNVRGAMRREKHVRVDERDDMQVK